MIDSLSLSFECFIGAILKAIEIETNTQHFDEFFLQNCKRWKCCFLTFLPVTWVKLVVLTVHQMNGWNLYFLAYFMCNIQKLNLRRPRTSNITDKFIASPFISWLFINHFNQSLNNWWPYQLTIKEILIDPIMSKPVSLVY